MRKIRSNNHGSAWPVIIFIICLAAAGITILIVGELFEPFMNLMDGENTDVKSSISAPRDWVSQFFQFIWPKGILLVILIGAGIALIMSYQKKEYTEVY